MRLECCLCAEIAACRGSIMTNTKVTVLMHHREQKLTTNTGRLASLALPNCEIRLRGLPKAPLDPSGILDPNRQALYLYPTQDAVPLNAEYLKKILKPITLIVPDGSWRQAFKVSKRELFLKDVPKVYLPSGRASSYQLRFEHLEGGLATFEAIARAIGIIEGLEIQNSLEEVFNLMVSRTLKTRGRSMLGPDNLNL